jgi:DNA-binding NtrC family response regulator
VIGLEDLPLEVAMHEAGSEEAGPLSLRQARERFEQAYVVRALERESWNQSRAARALGVHRNTLIARLAAWGIRPRDGGAMRLNPDAPDRRAHPAPGLGD